MFDNYVTAKKEKPRKWVGITLTFSVALHALAGVGVIIWSFWKIDKLAPTASDLTFVNVAAALLRRRHPPAAPTEESSVRPRRRSSRSRDLQPSSSRSSQGGAQGKEASEETARRAGSKVASPVVSPVVRSWRLWNTGPPTPLRRPRP